MIKVVLFGERKDQKLAEALVKRLSKFFHVFYTDFLSCGEVGEGREIVVVQTKSMKHIGCENVIVVFLPHASVPDIIINGQVICLVCSDNKEQIWRLAEQSIPAITCGFSNKDTITVSSSTERAITLALQRQITTLGGAVVEPMELTLSAEDIQQQNEWMLTAALLLFSDAVDVEQPAVFPLVFS